MKSHEWPTGKIDSTKSIWDVMDIQKQYYTKEGEPIRPSNYSGGGEIFYERSSFESKTPFKEEVRFLSDTKKERENSLIAVLSKLYGKRDGKHLSKVLENAESEDFYIYEDGHVDYLDYLEDHNSTDYDADFYQFAQWYDYALKRYAREKFLPKVRQHETEYAAKIRASIASGLLPESTVAKLVPFDTHDINYSIVDAFNDQDFRGVCSKAIKNDLLVKYHIELGLGDDEAFPSEYQSGVNDFEEVMNHESTHVLFTSPFGLYDNDMDEDWHSISKRHNALSHTLSESQLETIMEADEIITEAAVEWITQILNGATDTSKADTPGGAYHTYRQVLDSILNDGLEKIDARVLFSLCAEAGEELEANREKLFDALLRAYPDCETKYDIAEKIVGRFRLLEYQSRQMD